MTTPKAIDLKIFIPSKDFVESLKFYERLGWRINWREGGLAEIELSGVRNYLQDFYVKDWAENFMLYVVVENAQEWHDHIESVLATGEFPTARVKSPEKQHDGSVVTFAYDPAGVLLHLAEPISGVQE